MQGISRPHTVMETSGLGIQPSLPFPYPMPRITHIAQGSHSHSSDGATIP